MASEVELLEVFRLGVLAGDVEVVREVGDRLAGGWSGVSRFRDMDVVTRQSLVVQTSTDTLLWAGRAADMLGRRREALGLYEQRLALVRGAGDRAGEATTLNNIGLVYDNLGDRDQALRFFNDALPIRREVGDRAGEATTLNNIGAVYDNLGDRDQTGRA